MTLEDLGYNTALEKHRQQNGPDSTDAARVIAAHKERYVVKTADGEYEAEILGNLRYTAQSRSDLPVVGDWVAISVYDHDKALIHSVYPRKSVLERQSAGSRGEKQIIASNIDTAFIVQAVDRDFSINRIERYLTICHTSDVRPVIVLSKTDLVEAAVLHQITGSIRQRIADVPLFAVSNSSQQGLAELKQIIEKGRTYCLLGSSGVGKSTLMNSIAGRQLMKTDAISMHTARGRHITTHRELRVMDNGGILIDNPGMREVGIADASAGLHRTFEKIFTMSGACRFKDCTHTSEPGCAVIAAIEQGDIDPASWENYLKMQREKERFEATVAEKRKKDKDFGKMIKDFKKTRKSNKF